MTDQNQSGAPEFARGLSGRPDPHYRKFTAKQKIRSWRYRMLQRFHRGSIIFPVTSRDHSRAYPVTYGYGVRNRIYKYGHHTGEDHACPVGSLALATSFGHVIYAGPAASRWGSDYGIQVIMRTGDGKFDYAHNHLSRVLVKAGDKITPGMTVGLTGATGHVTGPHSHFEARPAGGRYGSDVHPYLVKHNRYAKKR